MPTACLFGCSDPAHTAGTSASMPWARSRCGPRAPSLCVRSGRIIRHLQPPMSHGHGDQPDEASYGGPSKAPTSTVNDKPGLNQTARDRAVQEQLRPDPASERLRRAPLSPGRSSRRRRKPSTRPGRPHPVRPPTRRLRFQSPVNRTLFTLAADSAFRVASHTRDPAARRRAATSSPNAPMPRSRFSCDPSRFRLQLGHACAVFPVRLQGCHRRRHAI